MHLTEVISNILNISSAILFLSLTPLHSSITLNSFNLNHFARKAEWKKKNKAEKWNTEKYKKTVRIVNGK